MPDFLLVGVARLQALPDRSIWVNDQAPFNRLSGNRSELLTLDYYSQVAWIGCGDFDNFKTVVVPGLPDGILSILPFGAQLPKLGMAAATGEIPVMMHFNLETGKEAFLDSIGKEEGMKLALGQLRWFSGEERFKCIAQKLLSAGRIRIYGEEDGREYAYTDICEKSFLQYAHGLLVI